MDFFTPDPLVRARLRRLEANVSAFIALDNIVYLHNVLATVVANHFNHDPVWTLLVGPSSSGKTELLRLPLLLPVAHKASNLRRANLLSGSIKKGSDEDTGLLFRMGDFGVIVVEDLTTLIQTSRDALGEVLALLREIFDGHVVRHFGNAAKDEVAWDGKAGFVGGVTPAIDSCHRLLTTMGDRFLMSRMSLNHDLMVAQGQKAVHRFGVPDDIRQHLAEETRDFLLPITTKLRNAVLPPLPLALSDKLVAMATLACRLRTITERGLNGDVIGGYINEMPARMACQFSSLLYGHLAIGLTLEEAFQAVSHVARSSVPAIRREVFEHVLASPGAVVNSLADAMRMPKTTASRLIQEMYTTRVFDKVGKKEGHFEISPELMDLVETINLPFPDLSLLTSGGGSDGFYHELMAEISAEPVTAEADEAYMISQYEDTETRPRIPEKLPPPVPCDMDAELPLPDGSEAAWWRAFQRKHYDFERFMQDENIPEEVFIDSCYPGRPNRPLAAGMRFGHWVLLADDPGKRHGKVLCRCDCGKERNVLVDNLIAGQSQSCGCARKKLMHKADAETEDEADGMVSYPIIEDAEEACGVLITGSASQS